MKIGKVLLKIISVILLTSLLISLTIPTISNASSLTDSAKKNIFKTVEDIETNFDENRYPGYKEKLLALKKSNPNWKFTIYYTGIDWKTAVNNEAKGLHSRSLVQGKSGEWLCETCGTKVYDAGGWMCASEKAVAYLMDARNYLNVSNIFQFEELSYRPDSYTLDGIEKVLNGTFMYKKNIREYYSEESFENITFSEAIMQAANKSGVSPYYLAARIRQEVGVNGSGSTSGKYEGCEGYYNFYNIGANSGTDPIGNGLKYAENASAGKYLLPWNDPVKSIKGGAIWIASNYIGIGQDTLYFQKFDVVSNGTSFYNHQYMQNIFAAKNEGITTYNTYSKLGLLDNNYNFIIPVYENMPRELSNEPSSKTEVKQENKSNNITSTVKKEESVKTNARNVIVRKSPGTSSGRITKLAKGTVVTRLEKNVAKKNGYVWDKVRLSNGKIGYMASKYLSTVGSTYQQSSSSGSSNSGQRVSVRYNNVNVRKSPGTSSSRISKVSKNTVLIRLERNVARKNGYSWDKVKLPNGKIGYIASKYLK